MGIDPEYFLDEMSPEEAGAIMKAKAETEKDVWERTRLMCFYSVVAMNGTKNYKAPSDLFELSWDKNTKPKQKGNAKPLTKEEATARAESIKFTKNKKKLP